jgi:hypothetical protein
MRTKSIPIFPAFSRPAKSGPRIPVAGAKAVCLFFAAFVVFAPLTLTAQALASSASTVDSAVSPKPNAADTDDSAELAQKLTNPLAAMISVPIQNWFDFNLGPNKDGFRYTMEAQPVYPMQISTDWNLISRTTIPIVYQQNFYGQNDPDWLERFDGKPFSFPRSYQVSHLGSRSDLLDSDRHQRTAQHAQVRHRADRRGA